MKRLLIALSAIALACLALGAAPAEPLSGGNAIMFLGARPNRVLVIDEATEKVIGFIPTKTGYPESMTLSKDKTRIYVQSSSYQDVEVIDVAKREVVDTISFAEPGKRVMIRQFEADPQHRFAIVMTHAMKKLEDRWEIGGVSFFQYDLKEHKVMRTVPWPKGEEREGGVGLQFSPDGKYLYVFSEDIYVYDTTDFKEVDKWELSRPLEDGFGRINFNSPTTITKNRDILPASSPCRTRWRIAASWESRGSTWRRRASTFTRSARRQDCVSRSHPGGSWRTACIKKSGSMNFGASTW